MTNYNYIYSHIRLNYIYIYIIYTSAITSSDMSEFKLYVGNLKWKAKVLGVHINKCTSIFRMHQQARLNFEVKFFT